MSEASSIPHLPQGIELLEAYPFTCPECGKEMLAKPSIFMTGFGLNSGTARCLCGAFVILRINEQNTGMDATNGVSS